MLLATQKSNYSLTTLTSLSFAFSSLGLFICSWSLTAPQVGFFQLLFSATVLLLSTSEIIKKNNRLLNGVALLIILLPFVFYLLLGLFTLLSHNIY